MRRGPKVILSGRAELGKRAGRGLVACANQNAPHTNNSQFFITMDRCDHLDRKNTIFGKVTGESIYNAMRLNEQEVAASTTHAVSALHFTNDDLDGTFPEGFAAQILCRITKNTHTST